MKQFSDFKFQKDLIEHLGNVFPVERETFEILTRRVGIITGIRHLVEVAYVSDIQNEVLREALSYFVFKGQKMPYEKEN